MFSPNRSLLACSLVLLISTFSTQTLALSIVAEGSALIHNQDLSYAKHQALRNASQQALLQAGAHISSAQTLDQGVIRIDNLRIRTLGSLSNVRVIDEQVKGERLWLRIRADVTTEQSCALGEAHTRYTKSAAIAAFPLLNRSQAALGNLYAAEQQLPNALTKALNSAGVLRAMNSSQLSVNPSPTTAASYQQDQGPITESLPSFRELDVQFIVSGVIRDLSPYDPTRHDEQAILKVLYDQFDFRGRQRLRNFAIDVFIHDGFTGTLLFSRSYRSAGYWDADDTDQVGFYTPAFLKTDYGQNVRTLLRSINSCNVNLFVPASSVLKPTNSPLMRALSLASSLETSSGCCENQFFTTPSINPTLGLKIPKQRLSSTRYSHVFQWPTWIPTRLCSTSSRTIYSWLGRDICHF